MTDKTQLTQSRLKEIVSYDPETGQFRWKQTRAGVNCNQAVGTKSGRYLRVSVDGHRVMAHRLAWLYMTGEMPIEQIDHINRDGMDNRWSNLRQATQQQNAQNTSAKGVHYNKRIRKFIAQISTGSNESRRVMYIGCFDDEPSARAAYLAAKSLLHPFYSGVSYE